MIKRVKHHILIVFCGFCLSTGIVLAENGDDRRGGPPGDGVSIGGGALFLPEYSGADTYRRLVVPWVDVRYQGVRLNPIRGLRFDAVDVNGWQAGPFVHYQTGRTNRGAISDFDNVSGGFFAGAYANYRWGPLQFRGDVGNALTGDIAGTRITLGATFTGFAGRQTVYSIGPTATWYSRNWNRGLYGVSPSDAAASGLEAYEPGSGVSEVRLTARVTYSITPDWSLTGFASAGRLTGNAADSPIVDEVGNPNQGLLGAVISYRF